MDRPRSNYNNNNREYRSHHRDDRFNNNRGFRRDRYPREDRRDDRHQKQEGKAQSQYKPIDNRTDVEVIPLHLRKSQLNNWDKRPAGCDGMTAEQVKQSGLFPYPGEPAKNTYLAVIGGLSGYSYNPEVLGTVSAHGPSALKAHRRLYVAHFPSEFLQKDHLLTDFINSEIREQRLIPGYGDVAISTEFSRDKKYAIVAFKSAEDAAAALVLDGVKCQGKTLEIRRPKDREDFGVNNVSPNVMDGPNKVFIGGLPIYLGEDQVVELLRAFGDLRSFNLVKDSSTGLSKGFAFCEFFDPEITDVACQGLNGMEIGDKKIIMQRSSMVDFALPESGPQPTDLPLLPVDILNSMAEKGVPPPTRVLMLLNMIAEDDLIDDGDYQDIYLDIEEECSKYGKISEILIPRPVPEQTVPGLGKIYVEFETADDCVHAQKNLAGRMFNDRAVITAYLDETRFKERQL